MDAKDFVPFNSEHAVVAAAFTIVLDGEVSPSVVQDLRARKDLSTELPAFHTPEFFEFSPGSGTKFLPRSAVQLSHLRPDGTPAWLLRLLGRQLSVECTRYSRWRRLGGRSSLS